MYIEIYNLVNTLRKTDKLICSHETVAYSANAVELDSCYLIAGRTLNDGSRVEAGFMYILNTAGSLNYSLEDFYKVTPIAVPPDGLLVGMTQSRHIYVQNSKAGFYAVVNIIKL